MKALLVKLLNGNTPVIVGDRPSWSQADAELTRNFIEWWAKEKLNIDLTIQVMPSIDYPDATIIGLDTLTTTYNEGQDFIIFVSDDEIFSSDMADGFTNLTTWVWVQHRSGSPDWAPLWNLMHTLSHEIAHIILYKQGFPEAIFNQLVHMNETTMFSYGVDDYWISISKYPVTVNSPSAYLMDAYHTSGYYDLLSSSQQTDLTNNPKGWLETHPYLTTSSYYMQWFSSDTLLTHYTYSQTSIPGTTKFWTVGGDFKLRRPS